MSQNSRPARGKRQAFGGEPLDPLSRRLLRTAGGLAVLLLLVLVNSAVNGSGDQLDLNPVAAAAERTEDASGARFSLYIVYSSPALPQSITAVGSGAYNAETDRSRATFELNGPAGSVQMVEIDAGEFEYKGGDLVERELPPGKEWVRIEEGAPEEGEAPLEIEDTLHMLTTTGEIQMVGREPVNGTMTRRYRSEIPLTELVDFLREKGRDEAADSYESIRSQVPAEISVESWVDRKGLLRRLRMAMPMPGESGEPFTVDMRMDIFDYGAQPDIRLPDPDRVVDGPLDEGPTAASIS